MTCNVIIIRKYNVPPLIPGSQGSQQKALRTKNANEFDSRVLFVLRLYVSVYIQYIHIYIMYVCLPVVFFLFPSYRSVYSSYVQMYDIKSIFRLGRSNRKPYFHENFKFKKEKIVLFMLFLHLE